MEDIRVYERFVSVPNVVQVQWKSDDPEFAKPSQDLHSIQTTDGLPGTFGRKDKITTVQGIFYCVVCECEIKSIVTLRDHCKGTQHKRRECQEKLKFTEEFSRRSANVKSERVPKLERNNYDDEDEGVDPTAATSRDGDIGGGGTNGLLTGSQFEESYDRQTDLTALLEKFRIPVVGLSYVTEIRAVEGAEPMYVCGLRACKEFSAKARVMFDHLHQLEHQLRYFKERYPRGQPPRVMDMEKEVIAEAKGSRDRMKTLVHRGRYKRALLRKTNKASGTSVMDLTAVKQEMLIKSEGGGDLAMKGSPVRERSRSPIKERSRSPIKERSRSPIKERSRSPVRERSRSPVRESSPKKQMLSPVCSNPSPLPVQEDVKRPVQLPSPAATLPTPVASVPTPKPFPAAATNQPPHQSPSFASPRQGPQGLSKNVQDFHSSVARVVNACMLEYYKEDGKYDKKIASEAEFRDLCRRLCHEYRAVEKDSHVHNGGTLEDITMTRDMRDRIELQVNMFFQDRPPV